MHTPSPTRRHAASPQFDIKEFHRPKTPSPTRRYPASLQYEEFHRLALRKKLAAQSGSRIQRHRIDELWVRVQEERVRKRDWSPWLRAVDESFSPQRSSVDQSFSPQRSSDATQDTATTRPVVPWPDPPHDERQRDSSAGNPVRAKRAWKASPSRRVLRAIDNQRPIAPDQQHCRSHPNVEAARGKQPPPRKRAAWRPSVESPPASREDGREDDPRDEPGDDPRDEPGDDPRDEPGGDPDGSQPADDPVGGTEGSSRPVVCPVPPSSSPPGPATSSPPGPATSSPPGPATSSTPAPPSASPRADPQHQGAPTADSARRHGARVSVASAALALGAAVLVAAVGGPCALGRGSGVGSTVPPHTAALRGAVEPSAELSPEWASPPRLSPAAPAAPPPSVRDRQPHHPYHPAASPAPTLATLAPPVPAEPPHGEIDQASGLPPPCHFSWARLHCTPRWACELRISLVRSRRPWQPAAWRLCRPRQASSKSKS